MLFDREELLLGLMGVFKIDRKASKHIGNPERCYDALTMRLSGKAVFLSGGKRLTLQPGELLYIPQNAQYSQETDGEALLAVHFINYGSRNTELEKIIPTDFDTVRRLVEEMYHAWNEKKDGYKYECSAKLYELLYECKKQFPSSRFAPSPLAEAMERVTDYIHTHYKKDRLSIAELAKMASLSESHFRRVFKELHGVSPNRYITDLRLEYASGLLLTRMYSVTDVSEMAGFGDVKYFERLFKARFCETPGHFRSSSARLSAFEY